MKVLNLTHRQEFIQALFISSRQLRYAFLKYFYPTQYQIPESSDLDIIVDKKELADWKRLIQNSPFTHRVNFREKSFALFVEVFFEDGSFLEIDLIYQCKWKFNIFLQAEEVLDGANLNLEGIKLASLPHSFAFLNLFYTLNNCPIPQKYQDFYEQLNPIMQGEIRYYLESKYGLPRLDSNVFDLLPYRDKLIKAVSGFPENQGLRGFFLTMKSLKDRLSNPGITITFSGVDGAGKSTILEQTRQMLTEKYRKEVVLLRQRPSILPILSAYKYGKKAAEQKAADTLPRTGNNTSKISSFIRFMYYYLDYVLGQFYVFIRANLKGHILLYDRYYFDYIIDSKRANIVLPSGFVKALYRFVFKPDLNFLLYADPDVILARKQELSHEDIVQLTSKFRGLFSDFNNKYPHSKHIEINNLVLEDTLQVIETAYQNTVGQAQTS